MQVLLNGLVSGSAIALLALAFQAVYLPTRVFFLGLAGIYAITPFMAYEVLKSGGTWWVAGPGAVATGVLLCLVCEWLIHAPLERQKAGSGAHLIASLGATIVIVQVIAMLWGNDAKTLRMSLDSVSHLGSVIVTGSQWITVGLAAIAIGAFSLLLMRSDLGLRLRALADNPVQFALFGYNVNHYRLLAFSLVGFLASIASIVAAYDVGFDPHTGLHAVLLAVVAVIIGGRGSFVGPVLGGLLLGVVQDQVVWYWSARWQQAVAFTLLALVLLVLPQGLLGRKTRLEANP